MIELESIKKSFGATTAVDDLTLKIGQGQVIGFLGPNGAGKSTTMRMITGFLAPDAGEITINGASVAEDPATTKGLIGYLPENNPLYEDMLVREYLVFTARLRQHSTRGGVLDKVIDETGIAEVYYRPIGELSKGYRQRVGLAQAILHEPEILILDEPTEGLDPNQRVEIRNLIRDIGRERTVLLSTHVLQEVRSTCDRVIIINRGRLVADNDIDTLMTQAEGAKRIIAEFAGAVSAKQLEELDGVVKVETEEGVAQERHRFLLTVDSGAELRPEIFQLAKANDWTLWELYQEEVSLEDVFRDLTIGHEDKDD